MGEFLVFPPQNCYLLKHYNRKKDYIYFFFFLKGKNGRNFLVVPPPNYYPLNPKRHNEKGSCFSLMLLKLLKLVTLDLFVDSVVCC